MQREKDDAYDFKTTFKPLLFGPQFEAVTLDTVLAALPRAKTLHITRHVTSRELQIPVDKNFEDAVMIIEFYLGKQWADIPESIQQQVLAFIKARKGIFRQLDGIAVIEKDE